MNRWLNRQGTQRIRTDAGEWVAILECGSDEPTDEDAVGNLQDQVRTAVHLTTGTDGSVVATYWSLSSDGFEVATRAVWQALVGSKHPSTGSITFYLQGATFKRSKKSQPSPLLHSSAWVTMRGSRTAAGWRTSLECDQMITTSSRLETPVVQTCAKGSTAILFDVDQTAMFANTDKSEETELLLAEIRRTIEEEAKSCNGMFFETSGDAFAILFEDIVPDLAVRLGEKVSKLVGSCCVSHSKSWDGQLRVSAGVGVAKTMLAAIAEADSALWSAKASGQSGVVLAV